MGLATKDKYLYEMYDKRKIQRKDDLQAPQK